jgi:hypothetical protein
MVGFEMHFIEDKLVLTKLSTHKRCAHPNSFLHEGSDMATRRKASIESQVAGTFRDAMYQWILGHRPQQLG